MKRNDQSEPKWYWSRGLHDANIISAEKRDSSWNPEEDSFILKLDCEGALFEADITELRFYGYKILNDLDIHLLQGGWWLSDEIQRKGDRYLLELKFDTVHCKTKHLKLSFHRIEVIRE